MKRAALAALAAALLPSAHAEAAGGNVRVLAPTGAWVLDFADERCSLIREFADGDDKIRLQIDSFGPQLGYNVVISGDLVAGSDAAPISEFRVGYSPDTAARERMRMVAGRFGDQKAVSFEPGFLPDAPWAEARPLEFERSVTHLDVEFRLRKPFRLDTGSMAAPFAAMHQCIDDLLTSWGIDPAEYRAQSRPPLLVELPDGYKRVRVDMQESHPGPAERRYRAIAEARLEEAARPVPRAGYAAPVRIMIDAAGRPTACVLQTATANEAYRQSVCAEFAGPYQPALDAEGHPVASLVQVGTNSSVIRLAAN